MEFQLTNYLIKKNSIHQAVEGNLPYGYGESEGSRKKDQKAIGQDRLLISTISTGCRLYSKMENPAIVEVWTQEMATGETAGDLVGPALGNLQPISNYLYYKYVCS